jgi:uncharacterized protein
MDLVVTAVAALVGALVFERLGVPAGELVGAMVAVAVVNLAGRPAVETPGALRFAAFVALGWAIGQGVTTDTLRSLRAGALPLVLIVLALVVVGGLLAALVVRWGWMDSTTAFLAASPGALSQMSALADALGANAALVAAIHTVRVVVVVLIAPAVARVLSG